MSDSKKLRLGIAGVGHLGKIHLKCALSGNAWEVTGCFDTDKKRAQAIAAELGIKAYSTFSELLEDVDAVDIVTPTISHFKLAKAALLAGKHVFIEKPVTHTVAQARELLALTKGRNLTVQVGHVERFNPAFLALKDKPLSPMFIESHRLSAFQPRGTDVSVVLDLMIHDLDLVLYLVKSKVKKVSAGGVAVLSETPDIANARVGFENGAVANLTASRISLKQMRKMRLFQQDAYISLDFLDKQASVVMLHHQEPDTPHNLMEFDTTAGKKWIDFSMPDSFPVNAIEEELKSFAYAIENQIQPQVTLEDGVRALELAHLILRAIKRRLKYSKPT